MDRRVVRVYGRESRSRRPEREERVCSTEVRTESVNDCREGGSVVAQEESSDVKKVPCSVVQRNSSKLDNV